MDRRLPRLPDPPSPAPGQPDHPARRAAARGVRHRRPLPRRLQAGLALCLVTTLVGSAVVPAALAAAPRAGVPPLTGPNDLAPQRLVADLLAWLSSATTHLTGVASGVGQRGGSGPQAHFGFGQSDVLAQATGTEVPGTVSPTAAVSTPPPVGAGTATPLPVVTIPPLPSVSPTSTASVPGATVGIPGLPIYPSHGELVPANAAAPPTAVPTPGGYRLQALRRELPHSVVDQCTPNVQVSAQANSQQSLQVTIAAVGSGNVIQQVAFHAQNAQNPGDRFTNAFVTFADQAIAAESLDVIYVLTPPQPTLTLWVSAVVPGQAAHVPMVVTDSCGDWQTFAGAGTDVGLSCLWTEATPTGTEHNPPYINGGTVGGVHTLTGSFSTSHTDASSAGLGPTPQLTRTYNSNDPRPGPLGPGWTHNYAAHLTRPTDGSQDLVLVGGQGRSDRYTYANGAYTAPPGVFSTLQLLGDGTYQLTAQDQSSWGFDRCGHLTTVTDPYGNASLLSYYPGTYHLQTISDPAGRTGAALTLHYYADTNGRLQSITDGLSRQVTYEYDGNGRLWKVHDRMPGTPDGGTITGNVTTFSYDGATIHLTAIHDARRPADSPCPSTPIPGCAVVTNSYDSSGKLHTQTDAAGQQTTFTYRTSPSGADLTFPTTSYQTTFHPTQSDTYDGNGWLTTEVSSPESGVSYTVSHTYDASKGVPASTTDGRGNTTTYCYDVTTAGADMGRRGLLTRVIAPSVATSDAGLTRPTTLTEYDSLNRPTRVYSPKGVNTAAVAPTCSADYTVPNALDLAYATDKAYSVRNELTTVTRRFYNYDSNGNRTGGMQAAITTYEYSATWPGQVTYETPPRGYTGGSPDHTYATAYTYYGPGDPQAGLTASVTPPAQAAVYSCYDAVGRLTAKSDAFGGACNTDGHHTDYQYDQEDRLLSTTSPPTTLGPPVGSRLTTSSTYDAVGHRLSSTAAAGNVTRYSYDMRGQLFEVRQSTATLDPKDDGSPEIARYAYDNLGHRQWVYKLNGTIQLTQAQYVSDGLGRLRQEIEYETSIGGTALARTYSYDADGNRLSQVNPNGGSITWGYDALNRQTSVTYAGSTPTNAVTYQYDRGGRRTVMTTSNQGNTKYTYDERDAAVRVETPYVGGSGTKVVR